MAAVIGMVTVDRRCFRSPRAGGDTMVKVTCRWHASRLWGFHRGRWSGPGSSEYEFGGCRVLGPGGWVIRAGSTRGAMAVGDSNDGIEHLG